MKMKTQGTGNERYEKMRNSAEAFQKEARRKEILAGKRHHISSEEIPDGNIVSRIISLLRDCE